MASTLFYSTPKTELEVRSNIILKYFTKWISDIIMKIKIGNLEEKIAYVDLCASFGTTAETRPICSKILQFSLENNDLRNMLSSVINDKNEEAVAALTGSLAQIDLVETLTFPPQINYSEVDEHILTSLIAFKTLPTFLTMDIWNYSGIELNLLRKLVNDNGADCLVLFDYKSIVTAVGKSKKEADLQRIFGKKGNEKLSQYFKKKLSPFQKEKIILEHFSKALAAKLGIKLPTPLRYKFYDEKGKTSHFLYFISQNLNAYGLMREIFSEESQVIEDGIGNLEFNPTAGPQRKVPSQTLFGSMFNLEQELLTTYKSQTLQMVDIYENHHLGRALVKKNYIDALLNLEMKNKITVTPKRNKRINFNGQPSLDDKVFVSFNK